MNILAITLTYLAVNATRMIHLGPFSDVSINGTSIGVGWWNGTGATLAHFDSGHAYWVFDTLLMPDKGSDIFTDVVILLMSKATGGQTRTRYCLDVSHDRNHHLCQYPCRECETNCIGVYGWAAST